MAFHLKNDLDRFILTNGKRGNIGSDMLKMLRELEVVQPQTEAHVRRVGWHAWLVAKEIGLNSQAALFCGIGHDAGKLFLPSHIFSGREITKSQFDNVVKKHPVLGSHYWRKQKHELCGLVAGQHHHVYEGGYGIESKDIPLWAINREDILDVIFLISVVDYLDAYCHRKTEIFDENGKQQITVQEKLKARYEKWKPEYVLATMCIVQKIELSI